MDTGALAFFAWGAACGLGATGYSVWDFVRTRRAVRAALDEQVAASVSWHFARRSMTVSVALVAGMLLGAVVYVASRGELAQGLPGIVVMVLVSAVLIPAAWPYWRLYARVLLGVPARRSP